MSYVTLALLTRARTNRLAALTGRQPKGPLCRHMPHDAITNVFADID